MPSIRNFEMRARTALPVVGAAVSLHVASMTHPNPNAAIDTTTTDASGMWEFEVEAGSLYDIKIEIPGEGQTKWYKGYSLPSLFLDYLPVYNVGNYGAVGDGATDDGPAIQAAIDAASENPMGGIVQLTGFHFLDTRLFVRRSGVHLRGYGHTPSGGQYAGAFKIGAALGANLPAIVVGGESTVGVGAYNSLEDFRVMFNAAPSASPPNYQGSSVPALICVDRAGYVGEVHEPPGDGNPLIAQSNGRVHIRNIIATNASPPIFVQVGTAVAPQGCGMVTIEDCDVDPVQNFVRVRGCGHIIVRHNVGGQFGSRTGYAFVRFEGAMGTFMAPDGAFIEQNFVEDYTGFVDVAHTSGSIGHLIVRDNMSDGVVIGVWLRPSISAGVNYMEVRDNQFNGFGLINVGGVETPTPNNHGVLVAVEDASYAGAAVSRLQVVGNRFQNIGGQGVWVAALPDTGSGPIADAVQSMVVADNTFYECGSASSNVYSAIQFAQGQKKFKAHGNRSFNQQAPSISTIPVLRHLVYVDADSDEFAVVDNVATDAGTSVVYKGTPGNSTNKIYANNYGPVEAGDAPAGEYLRLGPWHASNPGAGTAAFKMGLAGCDGNLYFLAPYAGRVVAISLSAVNNAGADTPIANAGSRTATATVQINGAAGTLAVTFGPDGAAFGAVACQTSGDTFAAAARVGVQLATGSGWVANDDVTVQLLISPT